MPQSPPCPFISRAAGTTALNGHEPFGPLPEGKIPRFTSSEIFFLNKYHGLIRMRDRFILSDMERMSSIGGAIMHVKGSLSTCDPVHPPWSSEVRQENIFQQWVLSSSPKAWAEHLAEVRAGGRKPQWILRFFWVGRKRRPIQIQLWSLYLKATHWTAFISSLSPGSGQVVQRQNMSFCFCQLQVLPTARSEENPLALTRTSPWIAQPAWHEWLLHIFHITFWLHMRWLGELPE